ncbi:FUSC family protein [Leifsonia kafniensis]|uniref:FUSC family protein n=1 Tax=Leifsonia kafniensis TaxID=475957 RepID=A0ABP7JY53_9MICO
MSAGAKQPDETSKPESLLDRVKNLRRLDFEVATRAALATAVPLIILVALGRIDWAAYASFGAMTALYGRGEPYRIRLRTVSVGALGLLVSIALGIGMSVSGASLLVLTLGLLLVIVAGLLLAAAVGLFPPTPIFFVFAYAVCAQAPTPPAEIWSRMLVAVIAAAFAWTLTMSGWLIRRAAVDARTGTFKTLPRQPQVRVAAVVDARVWLAIVQNVVGVLIAGGLAIAVGIGHPYWAVVSVVAVMPPPGAAHTISRAMHRIIGTAAGVVVTGLILLPGPPVGVLVAVIVIAQFGAEILVGRHYGAALLFVTPLALTVAHLASPVTVPTLLVDRVVETALGGGIAIAIVLITRAVANRRNAPDAV